MSAIKSAFITCAVWYLHHTLTAAVANAWQRTPSREREREREKKKVKIGQSILFGKSKCGVILFEEESPYFQSKARPPVHCMVDT